MLSEVRYKCSLVVPATIPSSLVRVSRLSPAWMSIEESVQKAIPSWSVMYFIPLFAAPKLRNCFPVDGAPTVNIPLKVSFTSLLKN